MLSPPLAPRPNRRLTGFAATVVLHLLLWWGWSLPHKTPAESDTRREAIAWIDVKPARPAPPKATPKPAKPPRHKESNDETHGQMHASTVPAVTAIAPQAPATPAEPVAATPAAPTPAAPAHPTAAEMLEQARRDIGKFDKELRREFATRGISKPTSTPQQRLAQGIEDAYDAVPPKWYESAKIKEIIDPGQYGRKRYKITTAFGTYCMTYESPNSPTAQLDNGKRSEPKMTNCPVHEQSATEQKW